MGGGWGGRLDDLPTLTDLKNPQSGRRVSEIQGEARMRRKLIEKGLVEGALTIRRCPENGFRKPIRG